MFNLLLGHELSSPAESLAVDVDDQTLRSGGRSTEDGALTGSIARQLPGREGTKIQARKYCFIDEVLVMPGSITFKLNV